jgi:hypothetical protein
MLSVVVTGRCPVTVPNVEDYDFVLASLLVTMSQLGYSGRPCHSSGGWSLNFPPSAALVRALARSCEVCDDVSPRIMASSGILRRVRTEVSKELSASIIRVTRIGELGTTLAVTSNRRTLRRTTKS